MRSGSWSVRKESLRGRFIEETGWGSVDWICLAVVKTIMNLLVHDIFGNFLSSWEAVNFSEKLGSMESVNVLEACHLEDRERNYNNKILLRK
jgi:hypothetical protein